MSPSISSWRMLAVVLVVLWTLAGLYVSFAYLMMLGWAWPNVTETPLWTQALAWTVVTAPSLGLLLALWLRKIQRRNSLKIVVASLFIQLLALFAPLVLT